VFYFNIEPRDCSRPRDEDAARRREMAQSVEECSYSVQCTRCMLS